MNNYNFLDRDISFCNLLLLLLVLIVIIGLIVGLLTIGVYHLEKKVCEEKAEQYEVEWDYGFWKGCFLEGQELGKWRFIKDDGN